MTPGPQAPFQREREVGPAYPLARDAWRERTVPGPLRWVKEQEAPGCNGTAATPQDPNSGPVCGTSEVGAQAGSRSRSINPGQPGSCRHGGVDTGVKSPVANGELIEGSVYTSLSPMGSGTHAYNLNAT